MKYLSKAYLESLDDQRRTRFETTHYPLGYHPTTKDGLYMPLIERYSGLYGVGVQGVGKSGFLINQISHDMRIGNAVIVIDPHGDLIRQSIAHVPRERMDYVSFLDMGDIKYPFGLNLLSIGTDMNDPIAVTQAIDRLMHVFQVMWPDVLSQAYLPRILRASCIALMSNPGSTLLDMHRCLLDSSYRSKMVQAVKDQSVVQFWTSFDALSASQQRQQVEPLVGRLESLYMGRSIVRNIVGQRETSINFRKAIERKEIIFIHLPLKTLYQDARLIGTLLIAQIHATIFSFGDVPENKRPGFSLYVDEFQHFATPDFAEMFTEGRKFGIRVCLAHQYRNQLPEYLRHATMTAATKVCFRLTPEDAQEVAHLFAGREATVKAEDLETNPVQHLLTYGSNNYAVQTFTDTYLRPLQTQIKGGQIEIWRPGTRWEHLPYWVMNVEAPKDKPKVDDPLPYLNHLLYEVMRTQNALQYVDPTIIYGFSNIGHGFYPSFLHALNKRDLLTWNFSYPHPMIIEGANGPYCARPPDSEHEQMHHFLFHLQATMVHLAEHPIGKKTSPAVADLAHMLASLPKRAAWVRSGESTGVIYTHDTAPYLRGVQLEQCIGFIREQTRQRYCLSLEEPTNTTTTEEPPPSAPRWEEID